MPLSLLKKPTSLIIHSRESYRGSIDKIRQTKGKALKLSICSNSSDKLTSAQLVGAFEAIPDNIEALFYSNLSNEPNHGLEGALGEMTAPLTVLGLNRCIDNGLHLKQVLWVIRDTAVEELHLTCLNLYTTSLEIALPHIPFRVKRLCLDENDLHNKTRDEFRRIIAAIPNTVLWVDIDEKGFRSRQELQAYLDFSCSFCLLCLQGIAILGLMMLLASLVLLQPTLTFLGGGLLVGSLVTFGFFASPFPEVLESKEDESLMLNMQP